jgi:hypothetical protein
MTDFPKGGDVRITRAWLDKKGFHDMFLNWNADAILGLKESDIFSMIPKQNGGEMLWGLLNKARSHTQCKIVLF